MPKLNIFKRRELIFIIIGLFLSVMTVGVIIYSINFLAGNVTDVLNQKPSAGQSVTKLNLDGLKKLGIMQ